MLDAIYSAIMAAALDKAREESAEYPYMNDLVRRGDLLRKAELAYKIALDPEDYERYEDVEFTDTFAVDSDDIAQADAVDAVEVVRCGECIHRGKDSWCAYVDSDANFFCKRGERRIEH